VRARLAKPLAADHHDDERSQHKGYKPRISGKGSHARHDSRDNARCSARLISSSEAT
jgi:hypothetical protein